MDEPCVWSCMAMTLDRTKLEREPRIANPSESRSMSPHQHQYDCDYYHHYLANDCSLCHDYHDYRHYFFLPLSDCAIIAIFILILIIILILSRTPYPHHHPYPHPLPCLHARPYERSCPEDSHFLHLLCTSNLSQTGAWAPEARSAPAKPGGGAGGAVECGKSGKRRWKMIEVWRNMVSFWL